MQHKTQASCAVRNHSDNLGCCPCMDQAGRPEIRRLPLPEPDPQFAASRYSAVRPDTGRLGSRSRVGPRRLRHTFDAAHKGNTDLPAHEEPAGGPTSPRPFKARIDRPPPWHRSRRRPGNLGANRDLMVDRARPRHPSGQIRRDVPERQLHGCPAASRCRPVPVARQRRLLGIPIDCRRTMTLDSRGGYAPLRRSIATAKARTSSDAAVIHEPTTRTAIFSHAGRAMLTMTAT